MRGTCRYTHRDAHRDTHRDTHHVGSNASVSMAEVRLAVHVVNRRGYIEGLLLGRRTRARARASGGVEVLCAALASAGGAVFPSVCVRVVQVLVHAEACGQTKQTASGTCRETAAQSGQHHGASSSRFLLVMRHWDPRDLLSIDTVG